LGSGIFKILFSPQFLHHNVFYIVVFVCYAHKPVVGPLLWSSVVGNASIVDYPNVAFFLADLPSTHGCLSIARGATRSLVVPFLSTVSCEVTGLSAEEACEDFPLSVLLNGSPWVSSFSTSSYALFASVSSWKEIVCFGYPGACPPWRRIHCIGILLRISPLAIERPPVISRSGLWFGFETIGSVPHMNIYPLLVDRCCSPLFVCCGLWDVS
jgi:hypothetical protein